ncbi:MAG: uncharacterized protein JWM26_2546 [Betaproteobacteria bacterium]|jgi:hypothetical protein|nr:uncharacterized protein [Betaproteobacteria bacterium]
MPSTATLLRPADVCRCLLGALDAADGRMKSRKRDQRPDAIGLKARRQLLIHAIEEDPEPGLFEGWLLEYARRDEAAIGTGAMAAMARAVMDEWRLAHSMPAFAVWLERGAPSDDASAEPRPSD